MLNLDIRLSVDEIYILVLTTYFGNFLSVLSPLTDPSAFFSAVLGCGFCIGSMRIFSAGPPLSLHQQLRWGGCPSLQWTWFCVVVHHWGGDI